MDLSILLTPFKRLFNIEYVHASLEQKMSLLARVHQTHSIEYLTSLENLKPRKKKTCSYCHKKSYYYGKNIAIFKLSDMTNKKPIKLRLSQSVCIKCSRKLKSYFILKAIGIIKK